MIETKIKDDYIEIVDSLGKMTKFIIIVFERQELNTKNSLFRNFIAKAYSLLKSISILLMEGQEGEAHALYRLLIERYLLLEHLIDSDQFLEFSEWSYIKSYEIRNKMRSIPEFNTPEHKDALRNTEEQIAKYKIYKERNNWKKPDFKKIAKQINVSFLYDIAYEQGSFHIHSRAEEGYIDALRIVKKETVGPDRQNPIFHQSILMACSILGRGLHSTDYNWGKFMEYYLNSIFAFLKGQKELPELANLEKNAIASNL